MGKKPKKPTLVTRIVALVKRNPWKFISGAIVVLGGIPGAVAGAALFEPATPAFHYWVRDYANELTAPIIKTQNTQALSIDRFLLYKQEEDLAKLKADPALPASQNLQNIKTDLEEQIQDTKSRICKATGKRCP